jgi:hypothetical protein
MFLAFVFCVALARWANKAPCRVLRRCMEAASSQALANMFWAHAQLRNVGLGLVRGAFGVSGLAR